jgi:CO dehydrogenase/acetyl-CoA synthase beta subunit
MSLRYFGCPSVDDHPVAITVKEEEEEEEEEEDSSCSAFS